MNSLDIIILEFSDLHCEDGRITAMQIVHRSGHSRHTSFRYEKPRARTNQRWRVWASVSDVKKTIYSNRELRIVNSFGKLHY